MRRWVTRPIGPSQTNIWNFFQNFSTYHYLSRFPENCGAYSDEHRELFHKEMLSIEERFKGKSISRMLSEYCWFIRRDTNPHCTKNKIRRQYIFNSTICIHAPKLRKLWLYWCSNYIFRIMNVLSGKWCVEIFWKKFQMFVWLGPIVQVTQRRISCPSECPSHMYRDIFWCLDCNFRSLNVVSGEWYGEKILEKIPSVPLTETYQSSHFTSNLLPWRMSKLGV